MYIKSDLYDLINELNNNWVPIILNIIKSMDSLIDPFLRLYNKEQKNNPNFKDIFKSFKNTDPNKISVIILYKPTFREEERKRIILTEMYEEYKHEIITSKETFLYNYNFNNLQKQGVLILNYYLTWTQGDMEPHKKFWSTFMSNLFTHMHQNYKFIVYLLWDTELDSIEKIIKDGSSTSINKKTDKEKREIISYLILKINPLPQRNNNSSYLQKSRFIGSNHFIITNHYLKSWHKPMIKWVCA